MVIKKKKTILKNKSTKASTKKSNDSADSKTTSKVKFGKTSVKSVREMRKKEEEARASRRGLGRYKAPNGKSALWVLPPTSDAMNGSPTVDILMHNSISPDGSGFGQCCRTHMDQPRDNCPKCLDVDRLWNKSRELKKEGDKDGAAAAEKLARESGVRVNKTAQLIDVTGAYDNKGKLVDQIPNCFGDNFAPDVKEDERTEKYSRCRKCTFLSSCQLGVQQWALPKAVYDKMIEAICEENKDITNPAAAYPIRVKRTGQGMKTKYTAELAHKIKIPAKVVEFAEKHAMDLTKLIKPMTKEQMLALMNPEQSDADTGDDKPKHSNKNKKVSSKKKFKEKPTVSDKQKDMIRKKLLSNSKSKHSKK